MAAPETMLKRKEHALKGICMFIVVIICLGFTIIIRTEIDSESSIVDKKFDIDTNRLLLPSTEIKSWSLRIVQFNIRNAHLEDDTDANKWSNRLPHIIDFLQEYSPDIVGLQELVVQSLNDLQSTLPNLSNYNMLFASRQPSNGTGDENNKWNEMMGIVWNYKD